MLLVQYGYIFLVLIFLLIFYSPEGSKENERKISEYGKLYSVPCDYVLSYYDIYIVLFSI